MKPEAVNMQPYATPAGKGSDTTEVIQHSVAKAPEAARISSDYVTLTTVGRAAQKGVAESDTGIKEMKVAGNLVKMDTLNYHYYLNDNNDLTIQVIDKESGEILREIPQEELQKLSAAIQQVIERLS